MKVTVSFGDMRIIVPCGDGDLRISELMERATNRYKRATQKGESCVVQVKYLETVKERARLDVDDLVMDVCDDKDMLTAIFNENNKHVKIDDVVLVKDDTLPLSTEDCHDKTVSDNDSGVAADAFGLLSNPESTRGSLGSSTKPPRGPAHRQHAKTKNSSFRSSISSNSPSSSPELPVKHLLKTSAFARDSNSSPELPVKHLLKTSAFARDSNRKSLSSNHPILHKWIDQQENSEFVPHDPSQDETDSDKSLEAEEIRLHHDSMMSVDIKPYTNAEGVEIGLIVQSIIGGSNSNYVGELQVADRITEVNGVTLQGLSNESALNVFNDALKSGEVTAKRTRSHSFLRERLKTAETPAAQKQPDISFPVPKQVLKRTVEEVKDAKESAVEAPTLHKIEEQEGNVFTVDLIKGSSGLGFTVTSKDVITSKTTRIFIKNILRGGAAIEDGRIQAGDEMLTVDNVPVGGKTQGDVVKLLRQAQGSVSLKLARLNGPPPPQPPPTKSHVASESLETPETFPLPKKPVLSPLLKAAVTSHIKPVPSISPLAKSHIKPVPSISPLAKKFEPSSITTNQQRSTTPVNIEFDNLPSENKENGKRSILDGVGLCKGCINLTIPLAIQDNVGLGISVKGKIMKETGEEKGIFVKSIVPGTNAEKDGRVLIGDQLLAVNNVTLKGMSNQAAMALLKNTLTESAKDGVIRINVNRFIQSTDSIDNDSNKSQSSSRSTDTRSDSMKNVEQLPPAEKGKDLSNQGVSRTKSYFKAVNRPTVSPTPKPLDSSSQQLFFQPDTKKDRGKVQDEQDNLVFSIENGKLWGVNLKEKDLPLPTYEQALHFKETQSLSGTPPKSGTTPPQSGVRFMTQSVSSDSTITSLPTLKVERGMSAISVSSLDSVLTDSQKVRFSRDGPGRSSMSEKKGRGQIDATKSQFYNKLKKFKSMEELRAPEGFDDDFDIDMDLRRTSSIDTITSRLDEQEKYACLFNRGTVFSASTPYFANEEQRNLAEQRMQNHDINKGFQNALDRTTSNPIFPGKKREIPDEKKKKGFLNSIGILLKRAKKRKEDELVPGHSPEYITNPDKFPFDRKALLEVYEDVENNNKNMSDNLTSGISNHSKYLQADQLQKKLVEEKINEMQMRGRKDKNKKHGDTLPKGNVLKHEGTKGYDSLKKGNTFKNDVTKGHDTLQKSNSNRSNNCELTGYQTWSPHDPKNMREQSKQFFVRDPSSNQLRSSNSLQRQHSLPPKNSAEVHRVLPRAPSGPMYKSPDRSKLKSEHTSPPSSSKNRQHESRNIYRKFEKDPQQRTPGKINSTSETLNNNHKSTETSKHSKTNNTDEKVTLRVRRQPSSESSPVSNPKTTTNRRSMPSISDLKLRSSVTISHKAEI